MRLVIDGHRLTADRTGVGRCLETLLLDWTETGWPLEQTVLVLRDRAGAARIPDARGLEVVVHGGRLPGIAWETLVLGRTLRAGDVLFAPANVVPWTWRGRTVLILYDTLPWSVPDGFPWHVQLRFGLRYRLAARRANRVIVPSEATARDVAAIHKVPSERISVVYPGVEPSFRPLSPESPEVGWARAELGLGNAPYFLFVGKRSHRRNVPAILKAFACHRRSFPGHRLVFVGPGGRDDIPGDLDGVIVAGHVSEDRLRALYADALALLYPSDHEGFGLPVIEAMACGCPVVTLRNSALVESGGDAAYYLPSADPSAITFALNTLAKSENAREPLRADGLKQAARFDRRTFAEIVKQEIRRVAIVG